MGGVGFRRRASHLLFHKVPVTNIEGSPVYLSRETTAQVVFYLPGGVTGYLVEYPGDRMFRVFLQAGCQLPAPIRIKVTEGSGIQQAELTSGQGTGFIENHRVDGVQGFESVSACRKEAQLAEPHGRRRYRGWSGE